MGIHLLNTFLQSLRNNGSRKIDLSSLSGRKIVVDIYIYMYRFKAMGGLLENIYLMCSIFRYYNISALFVFDGKVNKLIKNKTLIKRKEERERAKSKYNQIKDSLQYANDIEKELLEEKMNKLRRKFIKISKTDIDDVKCLLDANGMPYLMADGEADELCCALVIKGIAFACLSEDTDMFAYGCPKILKFISLINHTAILYSMSNILNSININFNNFQQLCLLSGTDYNSSNKNIFDFYQIYKKKFQKERNNKSFLVWLFNNKFISQHEYQEILSIQTIYNKKPEAILNNISYLLIKNKKINYKGIESIMTKENFIFAY